MGNLLFFSLRSPTVLKEGEIPTSTFKKWENPLSHNWKLLNSKILMELLAVNTTLPEKKKKGVLMNFLQLFSKIFVSEN